MRRLSCCLLLSMFTAGWSCASDVLLHRKSLVHFAEVDEGVSVLAARDRFVQSLSRFDRQSRMKTNEDVSHDDFLEFIAGEVVAWQQDDVDKLTTVISSIRVKLETYQLSLPETISLIQTSGNEEGGAAYCRGGAIILPRRVLRRSRDNLERLLLHELFHILGSHNSNLRTKLYAIVGFKPCGEIKLPDTLKDRKITNPDAPTIDFYVELLVNGKLLDAVPVLYASVDEYDAGKDGSFFRHMLFRMMVVQKKGPRWLPVEKDGRAVVFDPKKVPSYFDKIGKNTKYVIHPDEILADNFVLMVNQADPLPTPRIVEEMKKLLSK